jgi:hypothetical protein
VVPWSGQGREQCGRDEAVCASLSQGELVTGAGGGHGRLCTSQTT